MVGKYTYKERICKENKHNSRVLLSYSESKSNVSSEVFWSISFNFFFRFNDCYIYQIMWCNLL